MENQYKIQAEILQQRVDTLECEKNHWLIERERLQEENEKLKQQLEYADLPDLEEIPIIIIDWKFHIDTVHSFLHHFLLL